jgi:hypothetical protein
MNLEDTVRLDLSKMYNSHRVELFSPKAVLIIEEYEDDHWYWKLRGDGVSIDSEEGFETCFKAIKSANSHIPT